MAAEFEIYADAADCYRWRLIAGDDSVVARGGPYDTRDEADWETRAVKAAAAETPSHELQSTWPIRRRTA